VREGQVVAARLGGSWENVGVLVLATGQHDDGLYRIVAEAGGQLEPRPYQIGVRIEHRQEWVERWRYGSAAGNPALPAATYGMTSRPVTTFCMCPGGEVLPVSPEPGSLGTNGMSRSRRAGAFANSALITTVPPPPGGATVTGILGFRRELERRAYEVGGGDWVAPAQRAADFLRGRRSCNLPPTSYRRGVAPALLADLFDPTVTASLQKALRFFEDLSPGFAGEEALLIGPESRVSSPVRILRGPQGEALGLGRVYPCGEGSGYASGITSSALDGRRTAVALAARYRPPS
jgi:uncharacterized FAD-dependent dehydrogenase